MDAQLVTRKADAPDTAIISITDKDSDKNCFYKAAWLKAVLELQFDDVEAGGRNCITLTQAMEIACFVKRMRKNVQRIIVHCEFGQSRSAGIAAAISMYLDGHDSGVFYKRKYNPNRTCYHYVLAALRKRGK
jgi:predicted protein tyrosine phosphatase